MAKYYSSADLAEYCKSLRERRKLSMDALGEELGVSRQSVWMAENDHSIGKDGIRLKIIRHLAEKVGEVYYRLVDAEE